MKTPLTPAQLAKRLRLLANDMHEVAIDLQREHAVAGPLPSSNHNLIHAAELQGASVVVRQWANEIEGTPSA
jgi:hypothetical protein